MWRRQLDLLPTTRTQTCTDQASSSSSSNGLKLHIFTLDLLDPYWGGGNIKNHFIYSFDQKSVWESCFLINSRCATGQKGKIAQENVKDVSSLQPHQALVYHNCEALPSSILCSCLILLSCGRLRVFAACSSCRRYSM